MTRDASTPIGLYSIGIRGLSLPELLSFARVNQIPFLHLRGGPKGFDLAARPRATLTAWAAQVRDAVPVTMVTSDADLADFLTGGSGTQRDAATGLERLAAAANLLGASAVRLLARRPLSARQCRQVVIPDLADRHGLRTLVEPHHADWFAPSNLPMACDQLIGGLGLGLLVDSAQVHQGWLVHGQDLQVSELVLRSRVVHLSDDGTGLNGTGHHLVANSTVSAGPNREIAVEWTGPDRSPQNCLDRYQRAVHWWNHLTGAPR